MKRSVIRYLVLSGLVAVLLVSGCQLESPPLSRVNIVIPPAPATTTTTSRTTFVAPPVASPDVTKATLDTPMQPTVLVGPTLTTTLPVTTTTGGVISIPPISPSISTKTTPLPDTPTAITITSSVVQSNTTPPLRVTGVSARLTGADEISLTWNPSKAADFNCYSVYWSTRESGPYDWLASPAEASYRCGGLDPGTYYFYVEAIDYSDNHSEKSLVAFATVVAYMPVVMELFYKTD